MKLGDQEVCERGGQTMGELTSRPCASRSFTRFLPLVQHAPGTSNLMGSRQCTSSSSSSRMDTVEATSRDQAEDTAVGRAQLTEEAAAAAPIDPTTRDTTRTNVTCQPFCNTFVSQQIASKEPPSRSACGDAVSVHFSVALITGDLRGFPVARRPWHCTTSL